MIFFLQEEITDGLEVFKAWFEAEAIPQIEAAGGVASHSARYVNVQTISVDGGMETLRSVWRS